MRGVASGSPDANSIVVAEWRGLVYRPGYVISIDRHCYRLTSHSLLTHFSLTSHSLLTHYSFTTHSLLIHYLPASCSLLPACLLPPASCLLAADRCIVSPPSTPPSLTTRQMGTIVLALRGSVELQDSETGGNRTHADTALET